MDRRRHAPRAGHLPGRVRERLAARDVLQPRGGVRPTRPTSRPTSRPPATTPSRAAASRSAVDNPPLHALANGTSANGVYAYGAASGFPTASWDAANYWVDVLFAAAGAPGQVTGVTATAGQSSATVNWTAPASGGPVTSYKITPYIGAAAQTAKTITGSPPATVDHGDGAHRRDRVHVPRAGLEPERLGPGVLALQQRDAAVVAAPRRRPTAVTAQARLEVGDRPLDGAGRRRRQPDHRLHRHAVRRRTAQPVAGRRLGDQRARDRADQRHRATRSRSPRPTRPGTSPASAASNAVTPRASIFELATPATVDARRHERGRARRQVPLRRRRFRHRRALLQGRRRTPAPTSGACGRRPARCSPRPTFSGETASGWQTAHLRHAGRDHRRHDVRRDLPRAQRALLGHRRGVRLRPPFDNPPLQRPRRRREPQRRLRLQRHAGLPDRQLQRHATTGWTCCSPRRHDRARAACTARPARRSASLPGAAAATTRRPRAGSPERPLAAKTDAR